MADKQLDVGAVASEQYVDSLKRRLDILEKKLLGKHRQNEVQPPVRSTVESLHQKLNGLASGRGGENVAQVWRKIDTLEKMLSPEHASYLKLSEESKTELLLSYAKQLQPLVEKMDDILQLKDYLNTTEFQGLDHQEKKLAAVATAHVQQELQVEDISRQLKDLTESYQKIVLQLSSQCVEWDEAVSRLA